MLRFVWLNHYIPFLYPAAKLVEIILCRWYEATFEELMDERMPHGTLAFLGSKSELWLSIFKYNFLSDK